MKKTAAIFFLCILLFNWFGYRVLSFLLEVKATAVLIESIDTNQYSEDDLITIKLPTNLPYYTNSSQFSRIDGDIELNGSHYNFVKCRIYKDSIEYLCIPNQDRIQLGTARDTFYKLVNDLQHPSQSKKSSNAFGSKNLLSEYYQQAYYWSPSVCLVLKTISFTEPIFFLPNPTLALRKLPPDIG